MENIRILVYIVSQFQDNVYYDINFVVIGNQFSENSNYKKNITKKENKTK